MAKGGDVIVNIDDWRKHWIGGLGLCSECGALWSAVCSVDKQWGVECPSCGRASGVVLSVTVVDVEAFRCDEDYQSRML